MWFTIDGEVTLVTVGCCGAAIAVGTINGKEELTPPATCTSCGDPICCVSAIGGLPGAANIIPPGYEGTVPHGKLMVVGEATT